MKRTTSKQYAGQRLNPIEEGSFVRMIQPTIGKQEASACCDGLENACEDSASIVIDAADKITEVTFDGVIIGYDETAEQKPVFGTKTFTHETGFDRDDVDGITSWLQGIVLSLEIDAQLVVSAEAGQVSISHIGVLTLASIKHGSTVSTLTRKCTYKEYCTDKYNIVGDVDDSDKVYVFVNGVKTEIAGAYPYDPNDSAANTAKAAALKTALEVAWADSTVTVVPNADCGCYKVTARTNPLDKNYANGGVKVGCVGVFV